MDAVRIMVKAEFDCEHGNITIGEYQKILDPLHDVEPIVRCKDCIYADDFDCPAPLPTGYSCEKGHGTHTGDWYCADGERTEVESARKETDQINSKGV